MQEKSEKYLEFLERTDALASKLHSKVSNLPDKIGVSPAMFHACRSGKIPISGKTWRKLESAELSAGIRYQPHDQLPPVAESKTIVNDLTLPPYGKKEACDIVSRVSALENEVRILKCALASLLPRP